MEAWWENLKNGIYQTFILKGHYIYFLKGIRITLLVTVLALILGVVLGLLVAVVRSAHDQQPVNRRNIFLRFLWVFSLCLILIFSSSLPSAVSSCMV